MSKLKLLSALMLFIVSAIVCSSCSDDKDEPDNPVKQKSTYVVSSNLGVDAMASDHKVSSTLTLVCLEYNAQNELINTQTWGNVKDGDSRKFTANERCVKVVIRIELKATANGQTSSMNRYVATVNYLTINGNININLDGNTKTTTVNPI